MALSLPLSFFLPISFLPDHPVWQNLTGWWPSLLGLFIVLQFVAYLCWDHGVTKGNIIVLSLCADFIPWLSLLGTSLMLGVAIQQRTIAAAAFLVSGAMITRYGTLARPSPRPTAVTDSSTATPKAGI